MFVVLLPLDEATIDVLTFYDNLICVVFLIDFACNSPARTPSANTSST